MAHPRTSVADLKLQGQTSNLARALKRAPLDKTLPKREALEKLFADVTVRRDRALSDVAIRGEVLTVTKFSMRGEPIDSEVVNPFLKIAERCERQLIVLAKALGQTSATPREKTVEEVLAEADAFLNTRVKN